MTKATTEANMSADETFLGRLVAALRLKGEPVDGQAPAAVLWPDPQREWRPLIGALQERLPELLVLGRYDPAAGSGPAIWLRVAVEGALGGSEPTETRPAVLHLPGVSRQQLRARDDCPNALRPLVELLYRGAVWAHPNGREWTVRAFLGSPKALGLDVADDRSTRQAMLQALPEVAVAPLERLRGRRLEADDFRRMLSPDPLRDVLQWLREGAGMAARLGPEKWEAFRGQCRDELSFDPQTEADVVAGERLGLGDGAWARVWDRFLEAPGSYPQVAEVLARSRPAETPLFGRERWPHLNESDERILRRKLGEIENLDHEDACRSLLELDEKHGPRRDWVWARMGRSPLAVVAGPLARLASETRTTLGGGTPGEIAAAYVERGWQADAAVREALATAAPADQELVAGIVRQLLLPWLDDSARAFQSAAEREPLPTRGDQPLVEADEGGCLLFVDGLRYELGRALGALLEGRGFGTHLDHAWAALPTVTATGKPAVSPAAGGIVGAALGSDLAPMFEATGRPVDARSLRGALKRLDYHVLGDGALDAPFGRAARGWFEWGRIDSLGHETDASGLARRLGAELDDLADRIARLLDVGWQTVRVVTDHGWLMMPGGLPKIDLPLHLTVSRGARCAAIAGESQPDALTAPWHWNPSQRFAAARGAGAFRRGVEYAHGGLSVQECLIPDLTVTAATPTGPSARIERIAWLRFRCVVEVAIEGGAEESVVRADLRLKGDLSRSVAVSAKAKTLDEDGSASLLLAHDEYEASRLVLVLIDDEGRILDRRDTAVGEDS